MSYQVVAQPQAEEDIRQTIRWIARYSPKKSAVWYFDVMKAIESLLHHHFTGDKDYDQANAYLHPKSRSSAVEPMATR